MANRKPKANQSVDAARTSTNTPKEVTELHREVKDRLREEHGQENEIRRVYDFFKNGWSVPLLVSLVVAGQLFVESDNNIATALTIAANSDKAKIVATAAIALFCCCIIQIPMAYAAYWQNKLAQRYKELALLKLKEDRSERVMNPFLRSILFGMSGTTLVAVSIAPWQYSIVLLAVFGRLVLNGLTSPFSPTRIWGRMRAQGADQLTPEAQCELIETRVTASNLKRTNSSIYETAILTLVLVMLGLGYAHRPQVIQTNTATMVGVILGSSPQGTAILVESPRHVIFVDDKSITRVEYCRAPSERESRTVFQVIRHEEPYRDPPCPKP